MARTTDEKVREIIDTDPALSLNPFISTANSLVTWLTSKDSSGLLSSDTLTLIETWLAAHFYAHRDQLYQSKSTGGASGSFQGQTQMVLNSTTYGQTAMLLDVTNNLAALNQASLNGNRKNASLFWLGSEDA